MRAHCELSQALFLIGAYTENDKAPVQKYGLAMQDFSYAYTHTYTYIDMCIYLQAYMHS